jgi:tetratricopeptide (TPR) repeat protein
MNNNPPSPDFAGPSMESKRRAAAALHQKMQLAEARQAYRDVLQTHPQQVEALYALGVIAYQQRDLTAAADSIAQALMLKPGWMEAHNNLAVIFTELKQFEAARLSYDRAVALKLAPVSWQVASRAFCSVFSASLGIASNPASVMPPM